MVLRLWGGSVFEPAVLFERRVTLSFVEQDLSKI